MPTEAYGRDLSGRMNVFVISVSAGVERGSPCEVQTPSPGSGEDWMSFVFGGVSGRGPSASAVSDWPMWRLVPTK